MGTCLVFYDERMGQTKDQDLIYVSEGPKKGAVAIQIN